MTHHLDRPRPTIRADVERAKALLRREHRDLGIPVEKLWKGLTGEERRAWIEKARKG